MTIKYSQMRVLIIDDDEDDFIILQELLHDAIGEVKEISWAEDFNIATKMIFENEYDYYFVDNRLGAKLGLDLITTIKQQYTTAPPIIMLSGVDDHKTDLTAMEKGADDYLIKNQLTPHLLERAIRYNLRNKNLEKKLAKLAHYDSLTGLYNRSIFNELLKKNIEQCHRLKQKFSLVTLDLDNFKFINDNYGHPAGDQLLAKIARRLKHVTRQADIVARLGGDEFSLILKDAHNDHDFVRTVEKIIAIFQQPFQINSKPITVTTSLGIAIYPDDTNVASELVDHSDRAMYQAKNQGRNTYSFYNHTLHEEAKKKHLLEVKLKAALNNDELLLYYQPVIKLTNDAVVSFEALLRWPDGQGGFYNTEEFIEIAEESQLILTLGDWVFKQACAQLGLWQQQGFNNRKIAINVSANQFNSADFTNTVIEYYNNCPALAKQLTFELTERKPLDIEKSIIVKLELLSQLGFKFSVDDFGIGHSSISYLRAFPMNTIKIDKSIIQNILTSEEDLALCTAIIAIGKSLGMTVIAEGVETIEIVQVLKSLYCDLVQGYYFAKPMPVSEIS